MKRIFQSLIIGLLCGAVVLGISALSVPIQPAGCLTSPSLPSCVGSGVYLGKGYMLTNEHVARLFSGGGGVFLMPAWRSLYRTIGAPMQEVVYLNQNLDLGIVRLGPSMLNVARVATPCLSTQAVKEGETLTVASSPHGTFPPVSATLVVRDARPLLRLDALEGMRDENRRSAMTIITTLSADQARRVEKGSSGGPVLNRQGDLVGLVWTGRTFGGGTAEVWVTPASSWLKELQAADLPKDVLQVLLDARCP